MDQGKIHRRAPADLGHEPGVVRQGVEGEERGAPDPDVGQDKLRRSGNGHKLRLGMGDKSGIDHRCAALLQEGEGGTKIPRGVGRGSPQRRKGADRGSGHHGKEEPDEDQRPEQAERSPGKNFLQKKAQAHHDHPDEGGRDGQVDCGQEQRLQHGNVTALGQDKGLGTGQPLEPPHSTTVNPSRTKGERVWGGISTGRDRTL